MPCSPCAEQRDPADTGRTGLSRGMWGGLDFLLYCLGCFFFPSVGVFVWKSQLTTDSSGGWEHLPTNLVDMSRVLPWWLTGESPLPSTNPIDVIAPQLWSTSALGLSVKPNSSKRSCMRGS